jgi:UDP-galactose transporter
VFIAIYVTSIAYHLFLVNAVAGIFQIVLFTIFIYIEESSLTALKNNFVQHIFVDVKTTFKMALPPIFLILSNELLLISSNILPNQSQSASNYTIIGVAIFTVLLMKKKFFLTQALAVYFIANGLDQLPADNIISSSEISSSTSNVHGNSAIVLAILCYGISYVTLEKILKSSEDVSLWIRGIQLNLFTVPLSLVMSFTNDWLNDDPRGFFDSFNIIAWFFIIFKVAQSMMELFVIKIADSVYRCIALSAALVIMGIMKNPFIDYEFSATKLGTGLVIAGICLYAIMDNFPVWGEVYEDAELEQEYREAPVTCNETLSKGYQTVPTVSSCVSNADVYLKLMDEPTRES